MSYTCQKKKSYLWSRKGLFLTMWVSVILLLPLGKGVLAAENESINHYKMLSTIEYTGKGQFRSQTETLFTVSKQHLPEDKDAYVLSVNNFGPAGDNLNSEGQLLFEELSFIIDRKTRYLSSVNSDVSILEKVNNRCISSLKKVTNKNIGKTWKQSFNLSFKNNAIPDRLTFTLTAIQEKTASFGEMIAVRALSEPFIIRIPTTITTERGGLRPVKSTIGAIYLFDPKIEDIYMSISVFEAETNVNGFKENLRHEIATYKTDAAGESVDFTGLDKEFEKLVRKLGMTRKGLKVDNSIPLPKWAKSEGLVGSQVANMCVSTACEGNINPVATVCLSAARLISIQSDGTLGGASKLAPVSNLLAKSVPGIGTMEIAIAPAFLGGSLGTAGAIAGGTAGAIAIANGSSSSSSRSASTP